LPLLMPPPFTILTIHSSMDLLCRGCRASNLIYSIPIASQSWFRPANDNYNALDSISIGGSIWNIP